MNDQLKMIAGRIKELREIFSKDIPYMAKVTGVSETDYEKLESGKADFSFTFLQNIAQEFDVDVIELITGESPKLSGYEVVRKGEGAPLERRSGFKYLHLASLFKNKMAEPFMVTAFYEKDMQDAEIPVGSHEGEEFNLIIKGKLKVKLGNSVEVLNEGDSIYYNSSIPHGMIALDEDCLFLSMVMNAQGKALHYTQPVAPSKATKVPEISDDMQIFRKFATPTVGNDGILSDIKFHYNDNFNFAYDVIDELAKKSPDATAMVWLSREKEKKVFTFADMSKYSNKTANYFSSLGIKKGDKVMLILKRHYQFWFAILALHKIGAIVIPATNQLAEKDFVYRFNTAHISAVVCTGDGETSDECDKAIAKCPGVKVKVLVNGKKDGWLDFDDGVAGASSLFERVETKADDTMLMYFTSGTTGYPKITVHTFTYPIGHIVTAKYWQNCKKGGLHLTISETGWAKSVWGKLYGQWLCECGIFVYDFDRFHADDLLPLFKEHNITSFCAPPTMYRFFIKEDLSKYDLSSLEHACIAGEALNPEVFEQFKKATGLSLMEGFGQTELTVIIANLVGMTPKPGSMGKPQPQYDIDIVDGDNKPVKVGEVGEIVIRTDKKVPCGMFKEYYEDEAKTNEAWYDNIYHTGDTAWRDEDGYFWYVGRTDDLIKSSGYRIGPFEIESVLMELPYVLECAVTGVPDEVRGQVVKATIILTKDTNPSEELKKEIQVYVKEHTAPYKYPRIVDFVESLPKTISGKIKRAEIRESK